MSTATAAVFLPSHWGGKRDASSDLSLILDLVAREMARKHTAFYNIGFSEAKDLFRQKFTRKWGHALARGWATLFFWIA
jgi:predicted secreted Zn-dependent protease